MVAAALLLLAQIPTPPPYRLPWAAGEKRECLQGNEGEYSHHGDWRYAFDFRMPTGTKVLAARSGTVTLVKESESEGGADPKLKDKCNYVAIDHGDGTVGNYVHLQKDGALVEVGQKVTQGDVIGLSGQTGWAAEPHLHFHVTKKDGTATIAVAFADVEGDGVPKARQAYVSRNATGPTDEERAELWGLEAQAAFALRHGAVHLAWPRLKKLSEAKPSVAFEPVEGAKKRMEELERKGAERVEEIRKLPLGDGAREYLLARRAWAGTPVEGKLEKLGLPSKLGFATASKRAAGVDKAQERFFAGLAEELEGRSGAACYEEAVKAAPESEWAARAKERLR